MRYRRKIDRERRGGLHRFRRSSLRRTRFRAGAGCRRVDAADDAIDDDDSRVCTGEVATRVDTTGLATSAAAYSIALERAGHRRTRERVGAGLCGLWLHFLRGWQTPTVCGLSIRRFGGRARLKGALCAGGVDGGFDRSRAGGAGPAGADTVYRVCSCGLGLVRNRVQ